MTVRCEMTDSERMAEIAVRRAGKRMDMARAGRCYELSAEHAFADRDAVLVHGSIQGAGCPRLKHAWVINGTVWEPFGDDEWAPDVWERLFAPETYETYTWEESRDEMALSGHYGPWGFDEE